MTDIGIFNVDGYFQLMIEKGDFKGDEGLETSVIISLWSDKRCSVNELPPGINFRRGWWGDLYPAVEGDQIGSKLWTLAREKATAQSLAGIETYILDALNWMREDGVASNISVSAIYDDEKRAIASISIQRPDGSTDRFSANWDKQELKRA